MENIKVYNQDGNVTGEMEAPRFLSSKWNNALIHQVFNALAANKRKPIAHTKTRGEVSGGGIKPWRQKGTGRARHGSNRSPIWRHGGVSHGPIAERSFEVKINKKMKKSAFFSVLSKKLKEKEVVFLDQFILQNPKTKEASSVFKNLRDKANIYRIAQKGGKVIAAIPKNEMSARSLRNLPFVEYMEPRNLNTSS